MPMVAEDIWTLLMELLSIALYGVVAAFSMMLAFNFYANRNFIWVKRLSYFFMAFGLKQVYLTFAMAFRYSHVDTLYAIMTHGDALIFLNLLILAGLYPIVKSIFWKCDR